MAPNVALGAEGPEQRGWTLWLLCVVLVTVAGLFVALRLWERTRRRGLGVDDFMAVVALISSVLLSVTEIEAVKNGYGHRADTLSKSQIVTALKWFYVAQIMYKVVIMFDKISILLLYYRVFKVDEKFRFLAQLINVFIVVSNFSFIMVTIFQCIPLSGIWAKGFEPTHCINSEAFWISYAVLNISTDVLILGLPLNQLRKLDVAFLDKIGLALVFSTGLFFTAASVIRTTTLAESANDKDPTWGPLPATNWSVIEANVGLIAACLPTLRRPFIACFSCFFRRSDYASQDSITSFYAGRVVGFEAKKDPRHDSDASRDLTANWSVGRYENFPASQMEKSRQREAFLDDAWLSYNATEALPPEGLPPSRGSSKSKSSFSEEPHPTSFGFYTQPAHDPQQGNWPLPDPAYFQPSYTPSLPSLTSASSRESLQPELAHIRQKSRSIRSRQLHRPPSWSVPPVELKWEPPAHLLLWGNQPATLETQHEDSVPAPSHVEQPPYYSEWLI